MINYLMDLLGCDDPKDLFVFLLTNFYFETDFSVAEEANESDKERDAHGFKKSVIHPIMKHDNDQRDCL